MGEEKYLDDLYAGSFCESYRSLNEQWEKLCGRYLKISVGDSMWRYSRPARPRDPAQGWKLHIPATVLTASRVLEAVAPLLHRRGVLFKAPHSLQELDKLNSGIYYGYSQVGKFITVYPQTAREAASLARELHVRTRGMPAPSVPFDLKLRPGSRVYYRYGSFNTHEVINPDGTRSLAIRNPEGAFVPDERDSAEAKPDWVPDLLPAGRTRRKAAAVEALETPLRTRFRAFHALSQRGKGGVYQAFDLDASPPRLCVLKEGRSDGETGWDGRDGFWRVRHEEGVLTALRAAGVDVPRVYAAFKAEKNYFIAVEYVEGESLERWLCAKKKRIAVALALELGQQLAALISKIHAAGWVWRDCKPGNLMLTKGGALRPLDFEGACPTARPDPLPWGTPSYVPPEWCDEPHGRTRLPEDLYALGALIYHLLAGSPPNATPTLPIETLRPNVPADVCAVVTELLDSDPARRPPAADVAHRLRKVSPT